jgi:hypothetical protein
VCNLCWIHEKKTQHHSDIKRVSGACENISSPVAHPKKLWYCSTTTTMQVVVVIYGIAPPNLSWKMWRLGMLFAKCDMKFWAKFDNLFDLSSKYWRWTLLRCKAWQLFFFFFFFAEFQYLSRFFFPSFLVMVKPFIYL